MAGLSTQKALLLILVLGSVYYFFSRSEQINTWLTTHNPTSQKITNQPIQQHANFPDSRDVLHRQKLSDNRMLYNRSASPIQPFKAQKDIEIDRTTTTESPTKLDNNFSPTNAAAPSQPHDTTLENEEKRKSEETNGAASFQISKHRPITGSNEKIRFASEVSKPNESQTTKHQRMHTNNDDNKNPPVDQVKVSRTDPIKDSYLEYLESGNGEDGIDNNSKKSKIPIRIESQQQEKESLKEKKTAMNLESYYYTQPFTTEKTSSGDGNDDDIENLLSKVNLSDISAHDFDLSKLTSSKQFNQDLSVAVPFVGDKKVSLDSKPKTNFAFLNQPKNDAKELEREKQIKTNVCNRNYDIWNPRPKNLSSCINYNTQLDTCQAAKIYFNKKEKLIIPKCKSKEEISICKFTRNSSRTDKLSDMQLQCDQKLCNKRSIEIGVIDQSNGNFDYFSIENITAIKKVLSTKRSKELAYERTDFVFLSCTLKKDNKVVQQLLEFPPQIQLKNDDNTESINNENNNKFDINIITIDSISRPHFFRMLETTVRKMQEINSNPQSAYEILDFTSFQSLAPFTFVNLQALLSGIVDYKSVGNRRYFMENLLNFFKESEYQTLVQEDACWYDKWGSILTGNRLLNPSLNKAKIWEEVQNLTRYYKVDSLGLSHMSCEVMKKYGTMNLFNTKKMICLNNKPLSAYFIEYIENLLQMKSQVKNAKNIFSYTHINLGHETSGLKIKSLDSYLSKLFSIASGYKNNIMIFWSDHGAKTTPYSMDSLTGRFEVYDPFLFIMLPKNLKSVVGNDLYDNLKENQNSLTNIIDVRNTLLHILKTSENTVNIDDAKESLFSKSLKSRDDCSVFPARKYSLCKCINKLEFRDVSNKNNQDFLIWLGEYAIGLLNNKLTDQQTSNVQNKCVRLIGTAFENIISKPTKNGGVLWIFDVLIPFRNKRERFNFQVLFNKNQDLELDTLVMEKYQRVSVYSRYSKCKDEKVEDDLCICAKNIKLHVTLTNLERYQQFNLLNKVNSVRNSTCLFLLTRNHGNVVVMEIANLCVDDVEISFTTEVLTSWEISEDLPITRLVRSNKIIFIATFLKVLNYDEIIIPNIDIQIKKKI